MAPTRVVLIINDSISKIGWAAAVEFSKLGYRVAITSDIAVGLPNHIVDIHPTSTAQTTHDNYLPLTVDFKDEKQVDDIIPAVISRFGQLDVLVNNLSYDDSPSEIFDSNSLDEFNTVLQVNLFAPARLSQLAAPYLSQATSGGTIINILPGVCQPTSSCISLEVAKAGINMLTKTLANSFENRNVRCLSIASHSDGITKSDKLGEANIDRHADSLKRVVDLIVFLTSDKAKYINATVFEISTD